MVVDGVVEAPDGAHFTSCEPDYGRDEAFQREYVRAATRRGRSSRPGTSPATRRLSAVPRSAVARDRRSGADATRAEICVVACAEAWRGDGEILASPIGLIPMIGARLARGHVRARPAAHRRRGATGQGTGRSATAAVSRAGCRTGRRSTCCGRRPPARDDGREPDRPVRQPNISAIGDWATAQGAAARRARRAGQHRQPPDQLLGAPARAPRLRRARSTWSCGVGYDRAAAAGPAASRYHDLRRVVTNLGVFDFDTPDHRMRLVSVHPGVTVEEVAAATGFALVVPDDVPETRQPTDEELDADPRRHRPDGHAGAGGLALMDPHADLRPVRDPPPDRADRHGLGLRRRAHRGDVATPAGSASSPPRR